MVSQSKKELRNFKYLWSVQAKTNEDLDMRITHRIGADWTNEGRPLEEGLR